MDLKSRRLLSVCDDKVGIISDGDAGKIATPVTIGNGPDAAAFDPRTNFFFASNGEGNLTVIHEDSPDKFTVVDTVPTKRSARTMGLDLKTHNIFLPVGRLRSASPRRAPRQNEARVLRHPGGRQVAPTQKAKDRAGDWTYRHDLLASEKTRFETLETTAPAGRCARPQTSTRSTRPPAAATTSSARIRCWLTIIRLPMKSITSGLTCVAPYSAPECENGRSMGLPSTP